MKPSRSARNEKVRRISVSLPEPVYRALDEMASARRMENRSKVLAAIIRESSLRHREAAGNGVMAGMIALVYRERRGELVRQLFQLERRYLDEVISSLHVQLENGHRMEVMVVQGPVRTLRKITDQIMACKGVLSCKLTLTDVVIPPVHARTRKP